MLDRDYAVKRLEAAFRSLDDKTRLYQILFKHNQPEIAHAEYDDPLVRAAVEQRAAFSAVEIRPALFHRDLLGRHGRGQLREDQLSPCAGAATETAAARVAARTARSFLRQ